MQSDKCKKVFTKIVGYNYIKVDVGSFVFRDWQPSVFNF